MKARVLFCNIAYMQYYDFEVIEETPKYGGKYVAETGDALEKSNFHICEDGKVRGFVETKCSDSYKLAKAPNQIRIERIDENFKKADSIDNVNVFFCAHSERYKKSVLIGWYKKAVVYRNKKIYKGRQFNIECDVKNAFLVREESRSFFIPRASGGDYGFGRSNLWYAREEAAQAFVETVLNYTDTVTHSLDVEDNIIPQSISMEYSESGIGKKVLVNRYERNPHARQKCLDMYGTKCIICGFDSAAKYGEDFKDKIEVHHITPINEINEAYKVDPCKDIVPVCPDCHMILHTKMKNGEYPTVEFLKLIVSNKK